MEYNHGQPTREIVNTSYPIPKPQPPPARGLSNRPAIQGTNLSKIESPFVFQKVKQTFIFCVFVSDTRTRRTASEMEGKSEEEIEMMKLMGFGGFETTKVRLCLTSSQEDVT